MGSIEMRPKVVLVEDETDISEALGYSLRAEGYDVLIADEGYRGLDLIKRNRPRIAILDIMLPGIDGFEICRRVRADIATKDIPIIMLTAKDEQTDIVLGLGLGADDYITKPFSTAQLLARLRAVLGRGKLASDDENPDYAEVGELIVDKERYEATFRGRRLGLTATEFRILLAMALRPDCVFRRDELLNSSVGEGVFVIDRNIDVHMRSIRKKLGCHKLITTIRGVGYRLESSEAAARQA